MIVVQVFAFSKINFFLETTFVYQPQKLLTAMLYRKNSLHLAVSNVDIRPKIVRLVFNLGIRKNIISVRRWNSSLNGLRLLRRLRDFNYVYIYRGNYLL